MQVTGLFHVAIKTNDLDATVKFYTDVLGMKLVHRPDFGFPGAWIARGRRHADHPHLRRRAGARRRRQDAVRHRGARSRQPDHQGLGRVPRAREAARLRLARGDRAGHVAVADFRARSERRDDGAHLRRQGREPADAGDSGRSRLHGRQAVRHAEGRRRRKLRSRHAPASCRESAASRIASCGAMHGRAPIGRSVCRIARLRGQ